MKHYKIKKFASEAKKNDASDLLLINTLSEFLSLGKEGQQKYSLGSGLYKLRLATKEGRGKSAGSRSILAYKNDTRIIWLHLFAKNDKGNITTDELKKLKILSNILLGLPKDEVDKLIRLGELCEVDKND